MRRSNRTRPDHLLPDPAHAAEELGLVGHHSDRTRELVGAWRWPGLQQIRPSLLAVLDQSYVIDFGGAAGRLGYGSIVVDPQSEITALYDIVGSPNAIVASHVVEHIADLELFMATVSRKLGEQGQFVALVPSWRDERTRAEVWPFHETTFKLAGEEYEPAVALDDLLAEHGFEIDVAEYAENSNLIVAGHKA